MSSTIDQRVVEMRFDNQHFESNVKTTMSTLERLKASLNLSGASKGLENLGSAAKNVNMSGLTGSIDTVHAKFSALEVMAVTALANITNSAVNAGKRIAHALTLEPITTGFNEYETKINAVQTIMSNTASKGTTMADVTAVLNELNTYADKTIYNFAEMTKNIGTFTAAGVGLEDAASAIQGIANLAAASGSTSQQAATAMYQLSQALSSGTVKLMDWNSVVNAGMGGEKFQEALKATAREHGIAVDKIIKEQGSFRDSLSEGWISADILNETLNKFTVDGATNYAKSMMESGKWTQAQADALIKEAQAMEDAATKVKTFTQLWSTMKEAAQSGWSQTWELIIGDFEEAKEFLSTLSDMFGNVINSISDYRNKLLGGALNSGWDKLNSKIEAAGLSTQEFQDVLKETAKANKIDIDALIKEYGSLGKAIQAGKIPADIITKAFKKLIGAETEVTKSTKELGDVVERVIRGEFGYGEERVKALAKAGYDYATVQNEVNKELGVSKRHVSALTKEQAKQADQMAELTDAQLKAKGYTEDQIKALRELQKAAKEGGTSINDLIDSLEKPSGRQLLIESVMNILEKLGKIMKTVKKAWTETFKAITSDQIYDVIEAFHDFTVRLNENDENAENLKRTFKGLFAILKIVATITGGALNIAFKVVSKVVGALGDDFFSLTGAIGDVLVGVSNLVDGGIDLLADGILWCVKAVRQFIEWFSQIPEVQSKLTSFKSGAKRVFGELQSWLEEGGEIAHKFIDRMKEMDKISLSSIKTVISSTFGDVKKWISGALESVGEFISKITGIDFSQFSSVTDFFKNFSFIESISKNGDTVKGWLEEFVEFIKVDVRAAIESFVENVKTVDWEKILDMAKMVVAIAMLNELYRLLRNFADLPKKISNTFDTISSTIRAVKIRTVGNQFKEFAIAIGILAASVYLLSQVPAEDALKSAGIIAGMVVVLGGVQAGLMALSKFTGKNGTSVIKLQGLSWTMVGLAAGVLILAKALKDLNGVKWEDAVDGLKIMALLLAELTIATGLLSLVGGKKMGTTALTILAFAGALKILASAIKEYANLDAREMTKGLSTLTKVALGLALVLSVISLSAKGGKIGSILSMMGIVASLYAFMQLLDKLATFDTSRIRNNLDSVALVIGSFILVLAATRLAGKQAAQAGIALVGVSGALVLLSVAIKELSSFKKSDLEKSADVISQLIIVFGAVIALSKFAGPNAAKAGVMLLAMSGALVILSGVMAILVKLNQYDSKSLDKAVGAIAALELVFGIVIAMTGAFGTKLAGCKGTMIVMTASIVALAGAIAALALVDNAGGDIVKATACISALMGMFSLMIAATKYATKASSTLAILTGVVVVLGGVLFGLAALDVDGTMEAAASISLLMLSMAATLKLIAFTNPLAAGSMTALYAMTGVVALLAVVLGVMDALNVNPSIETAAALSILLLAMSGVLVILSGVGAVAGAALTGVGVLSLAILAIGTLIGIIGALVKEFPVLEEFLDTGIPILEKIGYAIGSFVGNIIGGALSGISDGLPEIGTNLSKFIEAADPFFSGINKVGESTVDATKSLVKTMLLITAADFLNGLKNFLGFGSSSLEDFAKHLPALGEAMAMYSASITKNGGIDAEAVEASANAALALSTLANSLPSVGGKLQEWFGTKIDLITFGLQMQQFGVSLKLYSDAVKGVDAKLVESSANAAMALSELANSLPSVGGKLNEWFLGEKISLTTFGTQLVLFGNALVNYSGVIKAGKLDTKLIEASGTAAMTLADLANSLPSVGGKLNEWFLGDKIDLASFGLQLISFGNALVGYSNAISGKFNPLVVTSSATAAMTLSDLANSLPSTSGTLGKWFFGEKTSLADFAENLLTFGENFATYSMLMAFVDPNVITNTTLAAQSLVALSTSLPKDKLFTNETHLSEFGAQLVAFGKCFNDYYSKISEVNPTILAGVTTQINRIIDMAKGMVGLDTSGMTSFSKMLKSLGEAGVNDFVKPFTNSESKVKGAATKMLDQFIAGVNAKKPDLTNVFTTISDGVVKQLNNKQQNFLISGKTVMAGFIKGVEIKKSETTSMFNTFINDIIDKLNNKQNDFLIAGKTVMVGFIEGVKVKESVVADAFKAMCNAAVSAIRDKHTDFLNAGRYLVMGFGDGISELTYYAEAKAAYMAERANQAAREALDEHSPSREGYKTGEDYGIGFGNGILSTVEYAFDSGTKMAESAMESVYNAVAGSGAEQLAIQEETNELSLEAQEAYWENRMAISQAGIEAETDTVSDLQSYQEEILSKTTEILSKYTTELDRNTDSLMNRSSIFSAVNEQEAVSAHELTKNLEDQVNQLATYIRTMESLETRLAGTSLLSAVSEMGVDSLAQLQAINRMTTDQLNEYVTLYDEKYRLAQERAASQLTGLKSETEFELAELYGISNVNLDEFMLKFNGTFETINEYVAQSVIIGGNFSKNIATGIKNEAGRVDTEARVTIAEASEGAASVAQREGPKIGYDLVVGFANGIDANKQIAINAAIAMAEAAAAAARSILVIQSPSKVFYEIGSFAGLGFVNALIDYGDIAYRSGGEMAESAIKGFSRAINKINESITDNIEDQPTIRPVLDLTDVETKAGRLNALLSRNRAMSISSDMSQKPVGEIQNGSQTAAGATYQFTQNNYSPKALSRVEIYRQTKNQFSAMERMVNA